MKKLLVVLAVSMIGQLAPLGSVAAATRCFDADNPLSRRTMRGNLDGDGSADRVWVGARRRDGRCRYFVFARTTRSGGSRVLVPTPDRFSRSSMRLAGRPVALVLIDEVPGQEVAVRLLAGASVQPFGFFTMRFGSLARMPIGDIAPRPLAARDMFAFGGGLSLMYATDCAFAKAPRTVVFSQAFPKGNGPRYVVERRWYQVRGASFARTGDPTERSLVRIGRLRTRFREFRNDGLLPHCEGKVRDARRA
jgi:hypothetical protein